jgi:glycosyltransferase involved in cell wall biosynthesis
MKILLSAYACEPGKGSEPGVGWHWSQEIAKLGHEVWVLTRENNRAVIEVALSEMALPNVHFVYYDLPRWLRWWKKGGRGIYLYYFCWQLGAFLRARTLARSVSFDLVQHITFVSVHQPSFMGLLGIPFVFGPISGGEHAPLRLRKSYPLKGKILERIRDTRNALVRWDPCMWFAFYKARQIAVTSAQTLALIPAPFHKKCKIYLAIGSSTAAVQLDHPQNLQGENLKILFVGRLIHWKGVHFALQAFAELLKHKPQSRFTIVGSGPDEDWLKQLTQKLGLSEAVTWISWMNQQEMMGLYSQYDVFLFPSLHDSGGMVVLEAMAQGLPVVTLDLGGPGVMVDEHSGFRIRTDGRSEGNVIQQLAETLLTLSQDPALVRQLGEGALARAQIFSWANQVSTFYDELPL